MAEKQKCASCNGSIVGGHWFGESVLCKTCGDCRLDNKISEKCGVCEGVGSVLLKKENKNVWCYRCDGDGFVEILSVEAANGQVAS